MLNDTYGFQKVYLAVEITKEQYHQLMQGFEVIAKRPILGLEQTPKSM